MISQTWQVEDEIGLDELDVNGLAETLTDDRCRGVLYYLIQEGGRAELDELGRSALEAADERATSQLHHVVLPKLDDVGLLTYDLETHTAELALSGSRVRDFLLLFC
jgi:hypothetical protein